jgi:hypothetical protein
MRKRANYLMLSMLCEDALSIRIYDIFLGLESRRMMGSLPRGCNRTAASVFFFLNYFPSIFQTSRKL